MSKGKMDDTDFSIIKELERDSRTRNIEIARKLGVSEGTVRKRIDDLVKTGLIKKFTIEFGVERGVKSFVLIHAAPQTTRELVKFLRSIPQVKTFYETTGKWDLVVRVMTESPYEFNQVIDKIRSMPSVIETESLIVLNIN